MSHYHSIGGCHATSFNNETKKDCLMQMLCKRYRNLYNARSTQAVIKMVADGRLLIYEI